MAGEGRFIIFCDDTLVMGDAVRTVREIGTWLQHLLNVALEMRKDIIRKTFAEIANQRCGFGQSGTFAGKVFFSEITEVATHIGGLPQHLRFDVPSHGTIRSQDESYVDGGWHGSGIRAVSKCPSLLLGDEGLKPITSLLPEKEYFISVQVSEAAFELLKRLGEIEALEMLGFHLIEGIPDKPEHFIHHVLRPKLCNRGKLREIDRKESFVETGCPGFHALGRLLAVMMVAASSSASRKAWERVQWRR